MLVTRRPEAAFTLVELLIGMVLAAIALAMIMGVIGSMSDNANRSAAKTTSLKSTLMAADQLTTDLRAARAPERAPRFVGSPDGLRDVLLRNTNPKLLAHDILVAEPSRLVFFAEVFANSNGTECIEWAVQNNGGLHRTVRSFSASCGGGTVLQASAIMPPRSTGIANAARADPPFSYRLLRQPDPTNEELDPGACTTPKRATANTRLERDQIVGVDLNLRSFVNIRGGRGDQHVHTSVSMAGRQGMEYRYGLGCVA